MKALSADTWKATGGAFTAAFLETYIANFVAQKLPNTPWAPVAADGVLGVVSLLPSIQGMRPFQLCFGAVFLAAGFTRILDLMTS